MLRSPMRTPIIVGDATGEMVAVNNPANGEQIATLIYADKQTANKAIASATSWQISTKKRAAILRIAADLYEENFGLLFASLTKEAGKTLPDAIGELREAVDFLRYYADEAEKIIDASQEFCAPQGIFTAISPWNFPLAIFTGQIAAALAMGNGVLAKPAEQTSLTAFIAVQLLHKAGVPPAVLQLIIGEGASDWHIINAKSQNLWRGIYGFYRYGKDYPPQYGASFKRRCDIDCRNGWLKCDDCGFHRPARTSGA